MESRSINGRNIRGVGFRAASWLGRAEGKKMPVSVASPDTLAIPEVEVF